MATVIHKKPDWYDKFELAGIVLQVIIALLVMVVLAAMTTQVGDVWKMLF